ncbi:MAG: hypothetical protein ACQER7_06090 [Bacteroidota bacterium]
MALIARLFEGLASLAPLSHRVATIRLLFYIIDFLSIQYSGIRSATDY